MAHYGVLVGLRIHLNYGLAAPRDVGGQVYLPSGFPPSQYAFTGSGTSYAAPLVAGAAVDLRDLWLLNGPLGSYGSASYAAGFINDPGTTYVQLLLMGDRARESGPPATSGFDSLYGNGRFRARMFNAAGMDDPWNVRISAFYVSAGQTVSLAINGGQPLPAGVDRLRVVLWWPEPDYVNGADMVMLVHSTCGGALLASDVSYDNKKRVAIGGTPLGGRCFSIDIEAFATPPNPWDSGQSRRYVYLAYYYEDEARDDLSASIQ